MLPSAFSKQQLEQAYTKTHNPKGELSAQEVKAFNDKASRDDYFDRNEDSDEENVEVLTLIQNQQLNTKYSASINATHSRIRSLQLILLILTSCAILYAYYNATQLRKLVLFNGTRIFPKQVETLFDYKPTGSKVFFGSQLFSLYFYILGMVVYSFVLLILFLPKRFFPHDEEHSLEQTIA